jgi:hypothetical protein
MSSASTHDASSQPMIHLSYECIMRERLRESTSYIYEVGCSITHLAASAHLFMRVTGEHTYRSIAGREIPFTRSETGATAYIELMEAEQLEVRIVEQEGTYSKAVYSVRGQELTEENSRRITSSIQRIDARLDAE